jgi:hypothetical protein
MPFGVGMGEERNVTMIVDLKLKAAKHDVVECARRLSDLCAEFDGDLTYCGEYLQALWSAIDRMKARERELGVR